MTESAKIIVQAQVWNNAQFITAPIMAIHQFVDEIQLFDGAYQFFKDSGYVDSPESTDGSKEILEALAPKLECELRWFDCDRFWKDEVEKKTHMLQFWKPGEWRYWLNDDEIPGGDVEFEFNRIRKEKKVLIAYVPMVEAQWGYHFVAHSANGYRSFWLKTLDWKPRFLKWQEGLHWKGKHTNLVDKNGVHRNEWPYILLSRMCLLHLRYLRALTRVTAQSKYESLGL